MTRRDRIEIADRSPLADWMADADAALDARIEARAAAPALVRDAADACTDPWMRDAVMPVLAAYALGSLPPARRAPSLYRWQNETHALRAWWTAEDRGRLGDTGRVIARIEMGASIQSSPKAFEPLPDEGAELVERVLRAAPATEARWTIMAHLELRPPVVRAKAGKSRDADGYGFGGCPAESALSLAAEARKTGKPARWQDMVAEESGADAAAVDAGVKRTTKALRAALRTAGLMPLPSRREMERDAPGVVVETCAGAPVVDGVRLPCETGYAPDVDAAACPRCEACGRARG